jgi:glucose/arabinose dehydrogenase
MRKRFLIVFTGILLTFTLVSLTLAADTTSVTTRNAPPDASQVQLVTVAEGFERPLYVTEAGDDSGRLFVVEQGGVVWILQDGERLETPFLDVSALITRQGNEQGLLGLAFHPNYSENGLFYINYTDVNGDTVVARYSVSADDANAADPESAQILMQVDQPYSNHNGGHMLFGPDGYLYIGLGDGGSAGDPQGNGQNLSALLGKLLRIDVDGGEPYGIPADNPFVDDANAAPEVWAYGLRNPWRFSFDRETNDLYIGDVGQNAWEELNFQPADSAGGENYGWNIYEATYPYAGTDSSDDLVMPFAEYGHNQGCSVTGGYVYRGEMLPDLQGVYLFADFCSGIIWSSYRDEAGEWQTDVFMETGRTISSFGEDAAGELYITDFNGVVSRFEPS